MISFKDHGKIDEHTEEDNQCVRCNANEDSKCKSLRNVFAVCILK